METGNRTKQTCRHVPGYRLSIESEFCSAYSLLKRIVKQTQIKRLEALTNDQEHIHQNALRLAGIYLQGAEEEIISTEVSNLDDEIQEDLELYKAHEALVEAIAREVVKIGRDLVKQAKSSKEPSTNGLKSRKESSHGVD